MYQDIKSLLREENQVISATQANQLSLQHLETGLQCIKHSISNHRERFSTKKRDGGLSLQEVREEHKLRLMGQR